MNPTICLAVSLLCLFLKDVQPRRVTPLSDYGRGFSTFGTFDRDDSIILTVRDFSADPSQETSVVLVDGGCTNNRRRTLNTLLTALIRSADMDSKFEFSARYTKEGGFHFTGFGDLTNIDDGNWEVVKFSKDGSEVTITSGLDRVVTNNGDRIVFSYRPVRVSTIAMETDEVNNPGCIGPLTIFFKVVRTGDLGGEASVICYTDDNEGIAGEDYVQRKNDVTSTIRFSANEASIDCPVEVLCPVPISSLRGFDVVLRSPNAMNPDRAVLGPLTLTELQ